jgi:G3E family GTPase
MKQPCFGAETRVPVTILTGYLGAGKTTLLNRILSEQHGLRIAVIVNEFGELGIDHQLIVATDESIVEMSNGCLCCTVRADLIGALGRILAQGRAWDRVIIETTGLADPGPVIQSFLLDAVLKRTTELDAIVTVVDAKHIAAHFAAPEAEEQIAFADVIVLNKLDLVNPDELEQVERRIRMSNPLARLHRASHCELPIASVLGLSAFDLSRVLRVDPALLDDVPHEHDSSVEAVCLNLPGTIDDRRLNRWLLELVAQRGPDLFRLKGILNVNDERRRFVVQGVHMLLDGRPGLPWQHGEERMNQLVFIGRRLDRAELERGFRDCFKAPLRPAATSGAEKSIALQEGGSP